jgi:hypothetical protein
MRLSEDRGARYEYGTWCVVRAILAHAAEHEPMNSTHAAVSDHEEIASVALRHVDEPAFGAPPHHVARLDSIARGCGAPRALELPTRQALDEPSAASPRPEHHHMNEPIFACAAAAIDTANAAKSAESSEPSIPQTIRLGKLRPLPSGRRGRWLHLDGDRSPRVSPGRPKARFGGGPCTWWTIGVPRDRWSLGAAAGEAPAPASGILPRRAARGDPRVGPLAELSLARPCLRTAESRVVHGLGQVHDGIAPMKIASKSSLPSAGRPAGRGKAGAGVAEG